MERIKMSDTINIYKYNFGDRLLVGVATKDPIDGRYYLLENDQ